ncbi:hypothetical protein PORY_001224, partial [Pneumocystis oryctolagi]
EKDQMTRPEHQAPPEVFYGETEAKKYTSYSRVQMVQAEMTLRSLELLNLPKGKSCFLMDIGCGSGLSGEILDQDRHVWVGMDISPSMLEVALKRDVEGDLILADIGCGMPFRAGSFDGAISISVLQWLLNADTSSSSPKYRLTKFFSTLYGCLARGARAVFQFYPETEQSMSLITSLAKRCGFSGGVVVDFPDSKKAKKHYMVLQAGGGINMTIPMQSAESGETIPQTVSCASNRLSKSSVVKKDQIKGTREWILRKKERYRKYKDNVPRDSKFTGRKRRPRF